MSSRFLTMLSVAGCVWALLFAGIAVAQEDTTEETTVLAADATDMKVDAETDNTSVEVDNGEVSVSTDDGTSQQTSASPAPTGDVNIGATRTSNNFTIRIERNGTEVDSDSTSVNDTVDFIVNERADTYNLQVTVQPQNTTTYSVKVDDCRGGGSTTTCNDPVQVAHITDPDKSETFDTTGNRFRVTYTVNFKNSNNSNNNRIRHHNRHRDHDRNRHRHHDRDRHNNRFFGRGAANQQYGRNVEERVIRETVPNKGRLAATGGTPLLPLAGIALLGTGLFVGRSVLRERR